MSEARSLYQKHQFPVGENGSLFEEKIAPNLRLLTFVIKTEAKDVSHLSEKVTAECQKIIKAFHEIEILLLNPKLAIENYGEFVEKFMIGKNEIYSLLENRETILTNKLKEYRNEVKVIAIIMRHLIEDSLIGKHMTRYFLVVKKQEPLLYAEMLQIVHSLGLELFLIEKDKSLKEQNIDIKALCEMGGISLRPKDWSLDQRIEEVVNSAVVWTNPINLEKEVMLGAQVILKPLENEQQAVSQKEFHETAEERWKREIIAFRKRLDQSIAQKVEGEYELTEPEAKTFRNLYASAMGRALAKHIGINPETTEAMLEELLPQTVLPRLIKEVFHTFDETLAKMRPSRREASLEEKKIIEKVYQKIVYISDILKTQLAEQGQEQLSSILENITKLAGKQSPPALSDSLTYKEVKSFLGEYFQSQLREANLSLESFAKGDMIILVKLFDLTKSDFPQKITDQIERELQALFPLVNLEEIPVIPYTTVFNAHCHDLVRFAPADAKKNAIKKSTVIAVCSRGFTYKARIYVKSQVDVAV